MSATTLTAPIPVDTSTVHTRPGLGRLVAVELRKVVNTRAGFWLQVATLAITVVAVAVRGVVGDDADHTFAAMLGVGIQPAAVLLPVAAVLLVTSEWSQRIGLVTFTLVPVRSRILEAKLAAVLVLGLGMTAMSVLVTAVGAALAGGTFTDAGTLAAQTVVFIGVGMVTAVGFGAALRTTTPALVALFALPSSFAALVSLPALADIAPWVDTARSLSPMHDEVMSATQWAHAGTSLVIWMLVPLAIGVWRVTRREAAV